MGRPLGGMGKETSFHSLPEHLSKGQSKSSSSLEEVKGQGNLTGDRTDAAKRDARAKEHHDLSATSLP